MKKIALVLALGLALSACGGVRGHVGGKKVCMNEYWLGVLSITEIVSPCGK
ncbi:MAG: hypothetical protein PHI50_00625 [Alphaproteobacteria bacterium]|nr:hypothetical protein [Alphaproteobacteria bacterium]